MASGLSWSSLQRCRWVHRLSKCLLLGKVWLKRPYLDLRRGCAGLTGDLSCLVQGSLVLREPDSDGFSIFNFWLVERVLRPSSVAWPFNVTQKRKGPKARRKMCGILQEEPNQLFFFRTSKWSNWEEYEIWKQELHRNEMVPCRKWILIKNSDCANCQSCSLTL